MSEDGIVLGEGDDGIQLLCKSATKQSVLEYLSADALCLVFHIIRIGGNLHDDARSSLSHPFDHMNGKGIGIMVGTDIHQVDVMFFDIVGD